VATIHGTDPGGFGHDYFPWYDGSCPKPPEATRRPRLWQAQSSSGPAAMPAYRPRFIHRDFHPGNVLWSRGRASGVVDWANACKGPAGWRRRTLPGEPRRAFWAWGRPTGSCPPTSRSRADLRLGTGSSRRFSRNSPSHFTAAQLAESEPRSPGPWRRSPDRGQKADAAAPGDADLTHLRSPNRRRCDAGIEARRLILVPVLPATAEHSELGHRDEADPAATRQETPPTARRPGRSQWRPIQPINGPPTGVEPRKRHGPQRHHPAAHGRLRLQLQRRVGR